MFPPSSFFCSTRISHHDTFHSLCLTCSHTFCQVTQTQTQNISPSWAFHYLTSALSCCRVLCLDVANMSFILFPSFTSPSYIQLSRVLHHVPTASHRSHSSAPHPDTVISCRVYSSLLVVMLNLTTFRPAPAQAGCNGRSLPLACNTW